MNPTSLKNLRPLPKGTSGNPGGRPKLAKDFKAWCQAQFETPEGRTLLQRRMKKSDYVLTRLLAYAYGEPKADSASAGHEVNP